MHALAKMNRAAALSKLAWDHYDRVLSGAVEATVAEKNAVARDVLDRALGKPKITAEVKHEHNSTVYLAELARIMDAAKALSGPMPTENTNEIIDLTPIQDKQPISPDLIGQPDNGPSASQVTDQAGQDTPAPAETAPHRGMGPPRGSPSIEQTGALDKKS
jgi:hypothetical protein